MSKKDFYNDDCDLNAFCKKLAKETVDKMTPQQKKEIWGAFKERERAIAKKEEELKELMWELASLIDTMKRCGNREYQDHPLVKNYVRDIKNLQEEIKKEKQLC